MARIFELLTVVLLVVIGLCQSRHLNTVQDETQQPDMKCMTIAPGLQGAYGFHCFTPDNTSTSANVHQLPQWFFNGEPIEESDKYQMGMRKYEGYYNHDMMPLMDMHLLITDVGPEDVGEYFMKMDMNDATMEKTMMLPAALACGNHPMCFEDNCMWPVKLSCKSNPDAYCQMDMCGGGPGGLCMPRWFVRAEEVICENVEEISYIPFP